MTFYSRRMPRALQIVSSIYSALQSRFKKTESLDNINQAIKIQENLLAATPPGNPNYGSSLHNLGILLQDRYKRNASLIDINRAISLGEEAFECAREPRTLLYKPPA